MTQSSPPTLSEDGFYGFLLVGLVVIYMYPEPARWSGMVRLFMGSLGVLLLYLYLSWLQRKRLFSGSTSSKAASSSSSRCLLNTVEYFPDTPHTLTGSGQIVPTADLVLGKAPCSRLTSGNARDALLAQVPGSCNPPNGSAGILQPAQFYRSDPIPKLGPGYSTPQLPDEQYRGMPNYANPEFVLQDPSQPKTWISSDPEALNSQMAPIPANQPYFYCDLYNRAAGSPSSTTTVPSTSKGSTESGPDRCGFQPIGDAYVSMNQKLAGGANPKTLVPPRIPNRLYDFKQWSQNPYITLPAINAQYEQELYQSGYEITDCIPTEPSYRTPPPSSSPATREGYAAPSTPTPPEELGPGGSRTRRPTSQQRRAQGTVPPVVQQAAAAGAISGAGNSGKIPISMVENENPSSTSPQQWVVEKTIDTAQGYHPQNLSYNEYVNTEYTPSWDSSCQARMNDYNRQIGTIPLGDGATTYSQVNQPDSMMSNLGISFTQPLLPTIPQQDPSGSGRVDFTEFDPMSVPQGLLDASENGRKPDPNAETSRLDIYDPRLTGYGTSYRGYVDDMTGQPRFYYDDIEATTQYNYLTRNALDWTQFGTTVGPAEKAHVSQCPSAMDVRQMANDTFANQAIFQRMDLQQRMMLKNSHREKQRRQAPIRTMNQSCSMRG